MIIISLCCDISQFWILYILHFAYKLILWKLEAREKVDINFIDSKVQAHKFEIHTRPCELKFSHLLHD